MRRPRRRIESDEAIEDARATFGDDIDFDAAEAQLMAGFRGMGVSVPRGRPFTREEAWSAAHESTDGWAAAAARAHDDGEPLSLDDIPEEDKHWRNFVDATPPPPPPPPRQPSAPLMGKRVVVCDLSSRPEYNGRTGIAGAFDASAERYAVKLDGSGVAVRVRPINLRAHWSEGNR